METSDGDEDYEPNDGILMTPPAQNLRLRAAEHTGGGTASKSPRLENNMAITVQVRLPTDLRSISAHLKQVSARLTGEDITPTLSLRVLRASLVLQQEYLLLKKKQGPKSKRVPPEKVIERVCLLFGMSNSTYQTIVTKYFTSRSLYESGELGMGRMGNQTNRMTRLPHTKELTVRVREFVRSYRKDRRRVNGRQVLDFFVENKLVILKKDINGIYIRKQFQSAYRITRRWLAFNHYKRGKRTGNLVMKASVILSKHKFLKRFFGNRLDPVNKRLREVMLDESYIHEHYHRNDDSIWDPSDEQDVQQGKSPAKGRRYCFAAAIQGKNHKNPDYTKAKDKAGLVDGSVWAFCPQKKEQHLGDYHKVFNGSNFINWFKNSLLPNLKSKSLIMMDNAKYHKVYGVDVPRASKLNNMECVEYLKDKGVEIEESATAVELKSMVKGYVQRYEKMEVERLAEEKGHEILFTPPYHSDLHPIELLWAFIKGNIGRLYDANTTLNIVHKRLLIQFSTVLLSGSQSIEGMIEKCALTGLGFYKEMDDEDACDEDEDDEDFIYVEDVLTDDENVELEDYDEEETLSMDDTVPEVVYESEVVDVDDVAVFESV